MQGSTKCTLQEYQAGGYKLHIYDHADRAGQIERMQKLGWELTDVRNGAGVYTKKLTIESFSPELSQIHSIVTGAWVHHEPPFKRKKTRDAYHKAHQKFFMAYHRQMMPSWDEINAGVTVAEVTGRLLVGFLELEAESEPCLQSTLKAIEAEVFTCLTTS